MDKKNLELNIAISLALILLVVTLVIFMKYGQKKSLLRAKGTVIEKRKVVSESRINAPAAGLEESKETTFSTQGTSNVPKETAAKDEGEQLPAVMLKDLPVDSIKPAQAPPVEETVEQATKEGITKRAIHTQPSLKDMRALKQQKGLIIY